MRSDLDKLYKKQILEEAKNAYHFEKKDNFDHHERAYNPICGDRFDLYIDINESLLKEIFFEGFGCTLSNASTSMMARELEGQTKEEGIKLASHFIDSIESNSASNIEGMQAFNEPEHFKGRTDCILLSWIALKNYLEKL